MLVVFRSVSESLFIQQVFITDWKHIYIFIRFKWIFF